MKGLFPVGYHAAMPARVALALIACLCLAGCGKNDPEEPGPGSNGVEVAPGDRLAWTQPAPQTSDITAVQFALYVDGARTTLPGAACTRVESSFECSAVLPTLTAGHHTLELAAFVSESGTTAESARSESLRVVAVARSGTVIVASSMPVVTVEQVQLQLLLVADGLERPSDLAFASDGSVFIAERGGTVRTIRNGIRDEGAVLDVTGEVQVPEGGLLSIALDREFDDNGLIYALYAAAPRNVPQEFTLARFRAVNNVFGQRAVLLDRTPASPERASGALRVGPDGKLYLAIDGSSDPRLPGSFASYNGKVLRLNLDATTPDDQSVQTPIFSFDHPQPQAMDWQPDTGHLWVVDRLSADAGRLSVITPDSKQRRAAFRTSYALPAGTGAASATFYRGTMMPMFQGNLFIAAESGRELMRLRFAPDNPSRIISVERLLKDQIGAVRVVAESKDGALYIATEHALYRLAP